MYTIDIDIGGTFTDGYFTDGRRVKTAKVLTTPHDITECIAKCVAAGANAFEQTLRDFLRRCDIARVSTTVGTNLLVQAAGPKIGLLVTKGFEGSLYGEGTATDQNAFIAPEMIIGLEEAVDAKGNVDLEIKKDQVLASVRRLIDLGARMIVVSFQNAWLNAHNERQFVWHVLDRYPVHYLRSVPMQLATDIVHIDDDYARTNSAILNAYIHTDMARSLYRAEDNLREAGLSKPLMIVHGNGCNARVAKTVAFHTLHSGPAVAISGAAHVARTLDLDRVITADMGGTSFDVGIIVDRKPDLDTKPSIFGMTVGIPMLRVTSLGGGGGSIARVDDGVLRVGPESAGAAPGPASYDRGGNEPTVTDANLLLGFFDPAFFLGGRMPLRDDLALRVMKRRIAEPLGVDPIEAAWRVRHKLAEDLSTKLTRLLKDAGHQPSAFTYLAMGGAGPLHACQIAEMAGIPRVVAFPFGSVFSAFGSCMTDIQHTYMRSLFDVQIADVDAVDAIAQELIGQASTDMEGEGHGHGSVTMSVELDVAHGDDVVCIVWEPSEGRLADRLRDNKKPVPHRGTLKQIRVIATCATPRPQLAEIEIGGTDPAAALKGRRNVNWTPEATFNTPVFDRDRLKPGNQLCGPALLEGPDTIYAVPEGWRLEVTALSFFALERE